MNESAAAWRGLVTMEPMFSLFVGASGSWARHASIAHKLIIGARGLRGGGAMRVDGAVTFIPAGQIHQTPRQDSVVAVALFDPRAFPEQSVLQLARAWTGLQPTVAAADSMIEDVRRIASRPVSGDRVLRAVQLLTAAPRIADAAAAIGLSEGRFTHIVAQQLGSPPQKWRGWLRLRRAIDSISNGASVTEAAHEAGFSDASHFSRMCVALLGVRPSVFAYPEIRLVGVSAASCLEAFAA